MRGHSVNRAMVTGLQKRLDAGRDEFMGRRWRWSERDTENVVRLRAMNISIRSIADVMMCSTRKVQDVLKEAGK